MRYIQSFGFMKDYNKATANHEECARKMGFEDDYVIPALPMYRYELGKF
jgi:hypothetical protein